MNGTSSAKSEALLPVIVRTSPSLKTTCIWPEIPSATTQSVNLDDISIYIAALHMYFFK